MLLFIGVAASGQGGSEWKPMFDGRSLAGWRNAEFPRHAAVKIEDGVIILPAGQPWTGITWAGEFPKSNYELRVEAMRKAGSDFFAGITFPAGGAHAMFVTGGWGGDIIGISSIDGWDASDNETRAYFTFETGRWYKLRIQVTDERIRVWIDEAPVVNVAIAGRTVELRPGDGDYSIPLGIASYNTTGAVRKVEYRLLPEAPPR